VKIIKEKSLKTKGEPCILGVSYQVVQEMQEIEVDETIQEV
jgi:hypothetical protein